MVKKSKERIKTRQHWRDQKADMPDNKDYQRLRDEQKLKIFIRVNQRPIANPAVRIRKQRNNHAILLSPNNIDTFSLNPLHAFIWKRLDGNHTVSDIERELRIKCRSIPNKAEDYIKSFIADLIGRELVEISE